MIWSSLNLAFSSVFQLDLMHKPTRTKFVTNINMHGYVILIDLFDLFIVFDDLANKQKQYNTNNTNPAKTKVLIISKPHISHPVLPFNNIDLSETDSYKYLGLIFHRTLPPPGLKNSGQTLFSGQAQVAQKSWKIKIFQDSEKFRASASCSNSER